MCNTNNYIWYKEHHICVKCGQEDAVKNHTLCFRCMIKSRECSQNYANKHRNELREKNRIKSIQRYYKLKELGICACCGKRKVKNNNVYCKHCSARRNERLRRRYLLNIYAVKNMNEIRV